MDRIQLRRDSSDNWAKVNPILLEGEVGFETDTKLRKIGDGVNRWNDLEYLRAEGISQETGNSQNITMSQDAITREISEVGSEINNEISSFKETITNQVNNYKPIEIHGDVTNAADEEDITSDENNLLKLKDRNNLNGMGYVILRNNKIFAEQLTQTNAIYEIRYDFDLNGEEVTIPEGCVLDFQGGSLNNGTIIGNNTKVSSIPVRIFNNIIFDGTFVGCANVNWFGARNFNLPSEIDSTLYIQNALNSPFLYLIFEAGYYYITNTLIINKSITIDFKGKFSIPVGKKRVLVENAKAANTVLWTNKNIDVLNISINKYVPKNSYDTQMLCINNGSIDVSSAENYDKAAIRLIRSKGVNLITYINTYIVGENQNNKNSHNSLGYGIIFDETDISENGCFYGGIINSYIDGFYTAIKNNIRSNAWITNIHFYNSIDRCEIAYDFGDIGINSAKIGGSIQTIKYYDVLDNKKCLLEGNFSETIFEAKVWDLGLGNDADGYTNQYIINPAIPKSKCPIFKGLSTQKPQYFHNISALDSLNTALVSYNRFSPSYIRGVDNTLYGYKDYTIEATGCTINSEGITWDSAQFIKLTDESNVVITFNNLVTKLKGIVLFNLSTKEATDVGSGNFKYIKITGYDVNDNVIKEKEFVMEYGDGGKTTSYSIDCIENSKPFNKIIIELKEPTIASNSNSGPYFIAEGLSATKLTYQHLITNDYTVGNKRPFKGYIKAGHQFFDTSLNKPIWWTGSKWVDATGIDV